jgi:hypothetical protein
MEKILRGSGEFTCFGECFSGGKEICWSHREHVKQNTHVTARQPFWRVTSLFSPIFQGRAVLKGEWTYVTDRVGGID